MRFKYLTTVIVIAAALMTGTSVFATGKFASRSVLADGNWVKVGVEQTGVYEISYETLRGMGFVNPDKVGIYGRGGKMLPVNLRNIDGSYAWDDDLSPIAVWHHNDKIYFYAQGVSQISYHYDGSGNPKTYFVRDNKNIYTERGYYFLTDSKSVKQMSVYNGRDVENLPPTEECMAFRYHEKDLHQNTSDTGQLFWGEYVAGEGQTWDVDLSDAVDGSACRLEMPLYHEREVPGTFTFGFEGTQSTFSYTIEDSRNTYFRPQDKKWAELTLPSGKRKISARYQGEPNPYYSNIDYWILSYRSKMPHLGNSDAYPGAQMRFGVLRTDDSEDLRFDYDEPGYCVLSLRNPSSPMVCPGVLSGGKRMVKAPAIDSYSEFIVFDTERPQLQISGYSTDYSTVANQNLHEHSGEGADFLIICTPEWRETAEKIADIHRRYENLKVVIATNEECYNEFSAGTPDPVAYRLLARMLFDGETKLKNVLLLGQLYADARGLSVPRDLRNGLIAYQSPETSIERAANNINDYIGMMADRLKEQVNMERNTVDLGVGILPFRYQDEADNYLAKLEAFYADDTWAYRLNKQVNIGGNNDKHTHDLQAIDMTDWAATQSLNAVRPSTIIVDSYGYDGARRRMLEEINNGSMVATYFGHGAETYLGLNLLFFTNNEIMKMKNNTFPFIFFAGCSLTNTDRGLTGIGESIVTGTRHGAIGTMCATRPTWAGQNQQLMRSFFRNIYRENDEVDAKRRSVIPTIGEIYARTKTTSAYANKLTYQLVCDPALRIPFASGGVSAELDGVKAISGEELEFTGKILGSEGNHDAGFNGEIVARLMEPAVVIRCAEVITGKDPNQAGQKPIDVTYDTTQAGMGVAEVKDGVFTLKLHVPAFTSEFKGQTAGLHLSAYDPTRREGAASVLSIAYDEREGGTAASAESLDRQAPIVNSMDFNALEQSMTIRATDNLALNLSQQPLRRGVKFWVDGREILESSEFSPRLTDGVRAMELKVPVGKIARGSHIAKVMVKDCAGNATEQEIMFTYNPGESNFHLQIAEYTPGESVSFAFRDETPAKGTLFVIAADGTQVWSAPLKADGNVWNLKDSNGCNVPVGHYKAYVVEEGNPVANGCSSTIDVPLI